MAARPTLGSIYAGEGSLLKKRKTLVHGKRGKYRTTSETSRFG